MTSTGEERSEVLCTAVFEYIEVECKKAWRPDSLRVLWQHEKCSTTFIPEQIKYNEAARDSGARVLVFETKPEIRLVIPLEQDFKDTDPIMCKFCIIANIESNTTQVLAMVDYDIAKCTSAPNTSHELDLAFQPVSGDTTRAVLGITIKAELVNSSLPWSNSSAAMKSLPSVNPNEQLPSPPLAEDLELASWLRECRFVNAVGNAVPLSMVASNRLIAIYCSASWCPPCHKFLPKLIKFYEHLKYHKRSFEIVYISSDRTESDMLLYMNDEEIPWVALKYDQGEKVRRILGVEEIPSIMIITPMGKVVVSVGIKMDVTSVFSSTFSSLQLYDKWTSLVQGNDR